MVMILVLSFMFSVPIFTYSTYQDDNLKYTYGINLVSQYLEPLPSEKLMI